MKLKNISSKIGLTSIEFDILLILFIVFLIGFSIRIYQSQESKTKKINYDYSYNDSLFYISGNENDEIAKIEYYASKDKKLKSEVLGFDDSSFIKKRKKLSSDLSININTADILTLTEIPGIGEKTAARILELREKNKGFKSIEDLMEVKGIGEAKLEKIKKYIIIE